ncbi:MAG: hypothetical protein AAF434_16505 [Pseudomonadota bacterium]
MHIGEIIDLARYPLDDLTSTRGQELVKACRDQLDESDSCLLPGFVTEGAIARTKSDGLGKLGSAWQVDHNFAYNDVNDDTLAIPLESLPPDHPRHFKSLTRIRFLARDLQSKENPARVLHAWQGMSEFIGSVMQQSTFPSACPLSSCILTIAEEGELQDWHFDGIDYIVTIMLEKPEAGGAFEYVSGLRFPDREDDYDGVSDVFKGNRDNVVSLPVEPGTLTLFRGKYNLHRAAPVAKGSRRIMAILSFEQVPAKTGTDNYLNLFYGRSLKDLNESERVVQYDWI